MICTKCKKDKSKGEYYKDSNRQNGLTTWCKACHKEHRDANREKQRLYMANLRITQPEKVKEVKRNSWKNLEPRKKMFLQAKNRASRKNMDFNISLEDIIVPNLCPLLEIPFVVGTANDYEYTYSLDRIDSSKGYVKGNVWVITKLANSMKNSASIEMLLKFASNVQKHFK